ncbi:MAG: hypothetical protein WC688_07370 [Parachlamydiales bacterium]|jgi:hypothetical protein
MNDTIIWILLAVNVYLWISLKKEKKRLRVLTSFVSGLVRYVSKVPAMIEEGMNKGVNIRDVKGYDIVLKDIADSFELDFWATPYDKFIKSDRNLFYEEKMGNDGFNTIFLDFYDKCLKEQHKNQHDKDKK